MASTHKLILGAALALGVRALMNRIILEKLRSDVRSLDSGDYGPLLSGYADDAVLHFNEGDHRWAGDHVGKDGIERFLQTFTGAGLKGEVTEILTSGPPWAMTVAARFNDRATAPDGEVIYTNKVVVLAKTRWGKIFDQADFYEDTERIPAFDRKLTELALEPD
ncbi:MAG: nuclear transport factor 2 family protein [Solirubrobacterales bacterium]